MNNSPGGTTPNPSPQGGGEKTRADALRELRAAFTVAGLDHPALDARLLLTGALGISAAELATRPDRPLTAGEAQAVASFQARRLTREPVARILGKAEFWGLPFQLSPETLVPRSDTETLVETALALLPSRDAALKILDLGTGTGCLLVALLHECPAALGLGIDRSFGALRTAYGNARCNGVGGRAHFAQSDWGSAVAGPFDLVVSNPPYIASPVIATLDPDVREYDPRRALDGGPDGLDAYRTILAEASRLVRPGGLLLFEIGFDQGEALEQLSSGFPVEFLGIRRDFAGNPRCIALKRT